MCTSTTWSQLNYHLMSVGQWESYCDSFFDTQVS